MMAEGQEATDILGVNMQVLSVNKAEALHLHAELVALLSPSSRASRHS